MPRDNASSSAPEVQTPLPFLASIIAVPVSWHIGKIPSAAICELRKRARATKRSLEEHQGRPKFFSIVRDVQGGGNEKYREMLVQPNTP